MTGYIAVTRGTAVKRFLITGGTGFIGRHLISRLARDGHAIGCVTRPGSDVSGIPPSASILPHDGSPQGMTSIVTTFAPDIVVHLASYFIAEHKQDDLIPLIETNVLFGTQLADAAASIGVSKFLNVGTSWQHYEQQEYDPTCLYAATKQAFCDILQFYAHAAGMRVITLELFDTFGPDDTRNKLIPLLLRMVHTGSSLKMSRGEQKISLIHVDDVVQCFLAAFDHFEQLNSGEAVSYAVRSNEEPSLRDMVGLFEELSGTRLNIEWGARPYRNREMMQPWHGPTLPGWQPQISLRAGLQQIIKAAGI